MLSKTGREERQRMFSFNKTIIPKKDYSVLIGNHETNLWKNKRKKKKQYQTGRLDL